LAFAGLILTLPLLMVAVDPRRSSAREATVPLLAVEVVLVGGLAVAALERLRLWAERTSPAPRTEPSPSPPPSPAPRRLRADASRPARHVRRAHAGRF
jgi:hypothetical protein